MSLSIANVMYINLFRQPHLSHIQTSQFFHLPSLLRRMRAQLPPMLNSPYHSIDSAPKVFRTYTIPQTRLPVRGPWDSFGLTLKLESNWIKLEHIPMHYTSHVARELVQCR